MNVLWSLVSGLLFGAGLVVSGMTSPEKVIGFLDLAGAFDPSLAFVMAGALAVYAPAYRARTRRASPLLSAPPGARIDGRLVAGAALFGIGWGMAGICPGPSLVVLAGLHGKALVFGAAMIAGALLFRVVDEQLGRRGEGPAELAAREVDA